MPFPSSIHMPGNWNSDGVHPGLFRPPVSPSPNADYLGAPAFAQDRSSRRRWSRRDVLSFHDTAYSDPYMDGEGLFGHPTRPQHRPYALAGQLGATAMAMAMEDNGGFMGESMFSDSDYRTALGSKRSRDQMEASSGTPTQLFHLPSKPAPSAGWGSFAMSTIGGVVGRFWEFCKIGTFKGFSAGGGASYHMTPSGSLAEVRPALPTPPAEGTFCFQANPWRGEHLQYDDGPLHAPFQGGRFLEEIPETPASAECYTPGPARKRRQTEYVPELGRNWVMIREPSEAVERRTPSKFPSPQRPSTQLCSLNASSFASNRFSTPSSRPPSNILPSTTPRRPSARTPGSRLSTTGSSRLPRPASAASFASFAGQPAPTPSKIPVRANPLLTPPRRSTSNASLPPAAVPASTATTAVATVDMAAPPGHAASRRRRHTALAPAPPPPPPASLSSPHSRRRTNSAASLASSRLDRDRDRDRAGRVDESSRLDAEARQLATQRKLEEREADVRMSAFNKRLQDMIRQGKEALGTTVEVDMMEEEEEETDADMWWDDAL